jgi:uncharacterized protein (TIGR03435 family)
MKLFLLLSVIPFDLAAQQTLKFEVASIKLRPPGSLITMIGGSPSGSRLTLEAMSLADLVSWSYDAKPWEVAGGPAWAGIQRDRTTLDGTTRRFDIAAKAEGEVAPSPGEFHTMLQSLLADRFHLAIHRETRETRVYVLIFDKSGPKFHESAPDAKGILRMNGGGKITGSGATLAQLVNWFSNANGVDRPIVDETGLTGRYDFTLEWSVPRAGVAEDLAAPDIFTAMREQLGIRLVPQTAPVGILVIDYAEMPGEN